MTRDIQDIQPLTAMQQGMLVDTLAAAAPVYLQHYDLELTGVAEESALRAALAALIERHDALRTCFVWDVGDQPLQVVRGRVDPDLTVTDLRTEPSTVDDVVAAALLAEKEIAFDLRKAPLLRVRAFRTGADRWRLVTTHHHLVLDGWSVPILHRELVELLTAQAKDRPPRLRPAARFAEFVRAQRAEADPAADTRYLTGLLGDIATATPLGADLPVPGAEPGTGRTTVLRPVKPDDHPDRLARAAGLLPSTVVHAAWALLLGRWSDVDSVVFGMTVAGRGHGLSGAAERVGMFVNTAPLRIDLPEVTVGEWLAEVEARLARARAHEQAPMAAAQQHSLVPSGEPLLSSVLAFQNYWRADQDSLGTGPIALSVRQRTERIDLPVALAVALPEDGVWVRLDHDRGLIRPAEAERLAHRCARLIALLPGLDPGTPLSAVPLDEPRDHPVVAAPLDRGVAPSAGGVLRAADGPVTWAAVAGAAAALELPAGPRLGLLAAPGATTVAAALAAHTHRRELVVLDPYLPADRLPAACAGLSALLVPAGAALPVDPGVPVLPVALGDAAAQTPAHTGPETGPVPRVAGELGVGAGDLLVVVAGGAEPAVPGVLLTALAAGATIELVDAVQPRLVPDATAVIAPAGLLERHAAVAAPGARLAVLGEPPAPDLAARLLAAGHPLHRLCGRTGCVPVTGPDGTTALGTPPGARVLDRHGRPAPVDVAGELVLAGVRQGIRVRLDEHGAAEQLGCGPDDDRVHAERVLGLDPAVAEAAIDEHGDAWLVPATGPNAAAFDPVSVRRRIRAALPARLRPGTIRELAALPRTPAGQLDRAALCADTPAPARSTRSATPVADRLGPDSAGFLARLRAAAARTAGLRHALRDHTPESVQQAQWRALAGSTIRPELIPAAPATGGLDHADYAAWQTGPERAAARAEQLAHWRGTLADAAPLAVPLDRLAGPVPAGTDRFFPAPAAEPGEWLAATALALGLLTGSDEVLLGVQVTPELPAELAGVPGPYARTLPLRLRADPAAGFPALAAAARTALAAARRNADAGWTELAALLPEPLAVSLAVHGEPDVLAAHAGAGIALDATPAGLIAAVLPDRAHPNTAARLAALTLRCLAAGQAGASLDPAALVSDVDELVRRGDGGPGEPVVHRDLPGWVRANAEARPDAIAVEAAEGALSYAGLVARAGGLAARLAELGVAPGDRVAVCLPRGLAMVWAPLGVLTAGAAYVPLDPVYPDERLRTICADAGIGIVITTADLAGRFPEMSTVDVAGIADGEHRRDVPAESAAYVIYTSGSTGKPKGVLVEHRAITDFSLHIARAYRIGTGSRLLGFAALTFDVSAFDLWTALTAGATLVLAGDEERASVEALQRFLRDRRVTAAELPPSLMPLLDPDDLPELRLVSVGGEAPAGALVETWATDRREFWNGYGPTETTVAVTLMRCVPPSGGHVPPIGLPMPGHRAYVLDQQARLVPDGVPGELCLAGPGVARGYLGLPGRTAERFVPDPYSAVPGARLYRTGDLVRWTAEGVLEFLGRTDRQVKVRGFRVELGDVEAAIGTDPEVRQVVVEPWDDPAGTRHLVAYVVPAAGEPAGEPTLASVRDHAAATLPAYMLPTRLVALDRIPLTASGKTDRKALPAPAEQAAAADAEPDGAWTETERTLATEVVGPLLGLSTVARDEGFFQLGGNSLQATQVTSRVRDRFGVEISLLDFFADPTVTHLAELVAAASGQTTGPQPYPALPMTAGARLPLSYPQQALYEALRRDGDIPGFHGPMALRLGGELDLTALRSAFDWLVRRHAPLRVTVESGVDGPVQVVHESVDYPFEVVDTDEASLPALLREEDHRPFDLEHGPLLRVTVYRLAAGEHVLRWNIHHLVTDGWSIGVQLDEIGTAYSAYAAGREPDRPPLTADYGEFVGWHRDYVQGPDYPADLDWWRRYLDGVPQDLSPSGPLPEPRPEHQPGWHNLRLPADTASGVLALARRTDSTLYMITLAAYAVLVGAVTGRDDLVVVTPYALRVRSVWEGQIGWFVNRVLVRLRPRPDSTFAELVEHVRASSLDAFAHGNVPLELLRSELGLAEHALSTHLSVQNAPARAPGFRGFEIGMAADDSGRGFAPLVDVYSPVGSRYQVSIVLRERPDGAIAGGLEYDAALVTEAESRTWIEHYLHILATATTNPAVPLSELLER